jgi:hypothetical protein
MSSGVLAVFQPAKDQIIESAINRDRAANDREYPGYLAVAPPWDPRAGVVRALLHR